MQKEGDSLPFSACGTKLRSLKYMGNSSATKDRRPQGTPPERRGGARVRRRERDSSSYISLRTGVLMLLATLVLTLGTYFLSMPDSEPVIEPPLPEDAEPNVTEPIRTPTVTPDTPSAPDASTTDPAPDQGTTPPPETADPPTQSGGGDASQPQQPSGGGEAPPVSAPADGVPSEKQEELDHLVQVVLEKIVSDDMSKLEQARAVFDFTRTKISYTGDSDKSDWLNGAYEGLTTRKGDCFTYYAVSRALLTALGIDNLEVQRLGGPTSHFWNLVNCGDGWYHFDATPRSSKMPAFVSFMFTDAEAADYTARAGREYYTFDGSLLPERATGEPGEAQPENTAAEVTPPPADADANSAPEAGNTTLSAGTEPGAEQEAHNAA